MPNYSIDAIKIAKAIQKNKLSILRGKEFKMRGKIKKKEETTHHPGDKNMKKSRTDRLEERMDRLETLITDLTKEMRNGFKQVNSRIDQINARLDYIVKANNLKDLSK